MTVIEFDPCHPTPEGKPTVKLYGSGLDVRVQDELVELDGAEVFTAGDLQRVARGIGAESVQGASRASVDAEFAEAV